MPVYKPRRKSSYQVVREFKKKFPGEKVGHAGTLDPLAEGLLIILIGKATKRQAEFMGLVKEYIVEAVFGLNSPTWDLEKEPKLFANAKKIQEKLRNLSREKIEKVLKSFTGEFEQIIPAYSAVHLDGKRLYKEARKGRQFSDAELPRRIVEIKEIEILEFKPMCHSERSRIPSGILRSRGIPFLKLVADKGIPPRPCTIRYRVGRNDTISDFLLKYGPKIKLRLVVGKGAYIRSVVYQLGKALGVGAVVTKLVRTKVGNFHLGSGTFLSRSEEK